MVVTMQQNEEYRVEWIKRFKHIRKQRETMWNELHNPEVDPEWIIKRPTTHQWAIDEIIRHMLASEIRYIHQSFNPNIPQLDEAVPAQWVKNRFFRLEEKTHVKLKRLKEIALSIESETVKFLDSSDKAYEEKTKAPWGEEMKVFELLETFYTHEFYHQGQVFFILTYFRGLPIVIKSQLES